MFAAVEVPELVIGAVTLTTPLEPVAPVAPVAPTSPATVNFQALWEPEPLNLSTVMISVPPPM